MIWWFRGHITSGLIGAKPRRSSDRTWHISADAHIESGQASASIYILLLSKRRSFCHFRAWDNLSRKGWQLSAWLFGMICQYALQSAPALPWDLPSRIQAALFLPMWHPKGQFGTLGSSPCHFDTLKYAYRDYGVRALLRIVNCQRNVQEIGEWLLHSWSSWHNWLEPRHSWNTRSSWQMPHYLYQNRNSWGTWLRIRQCFLYYLHRTDVSAKSKIPEKSLLWIWMR